jgi:hypothetical protein
MACGSRRVARLSCWAGGRASLSAVRPSRSHRFAATQLDQASALIIGSQIVPFFKTPSSVLYVTSQGGVLLPLSASGQGW